MTGVAGFIGSHVAQRFLEEGYQVFGADNLSNGKRENIPEGVEFFQVDLSEPGEVALLPGNVDAILHLAGQSSGEISFDDPVADLEKNTVSTLNLIHHGITSGLGRMVYASSMSVYGAVPDQAIAEEHLCCPLSCYGVGKYASEGYLRIYQKQLPSVALRMFNVYGPGQDLSNLRQGMVSIYLAQALRGGNIEVKGSVERFRDFVYIDDVVVAWYRAATADGVCGKVFNVASGVRTTVGALLEKICKQVVGSSYFINGATLGDQSGIYADVSALRGILGANGKVDLEEGLKRFIDWASKAV